MHSRAVIKSDVSVSIVHGSKGENDVNMTLVFALEVAFFKTHAVNVPFPQAFGRRNYRFTGSFSSKISIFHVSQFVLCNNSDQT